MSFDAVLLDLYDTIVWSEWNQLRDLIADKTGLDHQLLLKAFDVSRRARGVGSYGDAHGDMRAVLEAAGLSPDESFVRTLVDLEHGYLVSGVHLYEDTLPALGSLRERGIRTALVSNCSHSTRPVIDRLALGTAFDAVILSFEVRAMKPDAAIYRAALAALGGIDPSRAVFVDDQPAYCEGAAAVGLQTRLILRPEDLSFETLTGAGAPPRSLDGHQVVTDLRWLG